MVLLSPGSSLRTHKPPRVDVEKKLSANPLTLRMHGFEKPGVPHGTIEALSETVGHY
jgi:hypothetical protein